ncbi:MAG: SIMPL domain-containing protein [Steroidobacteraceae bacterium]|jgi:uncharacterized protein YggE|nr:SIMPL domain-containing protein [Steroidobacteraceae bacterium]
MRIPSGALAATLIAFTAFAAAPADADDDARTLSVAGIGEIRAEPDMATVTLGVTARNPALDAARQQANRVVESLLKLTRDLKIPDAQVRSTRISVNPEYDWNEAKRQQEFRAYVVTRQLVIDLRDLEKLGALLERSVTAGANLVQEPVLDSSKRTDLERQALALAVEDARKNAEVLARAVGMAVGPARSVTGGDSTRPPGPPMPMMVMARAEMKSDAAATYQAGELLFGATASVVYDLVPAAGARAR